MSNGKIWNLFEKEEVEEDVCRDGAKENETLEMVLESNVKWKNTEEVEEDEQAELWTHLGSLLRDLLSIPSCRTSIKIADYGHSSTQLRINYGIVDEANSYDCLVIEVLSEFRTGYTPTDYQSESELRVSLLMEQSFAVKCPSISYHLVGTKKMAQEVTKLNVLS
ncbi:hypothetical protein G4B88_004967 [Cannabis sativa]|uniref:Glutathione synthase substrate-binding domain-containing protein n=1 Tax=Cannabis sativa TaxID=3483 RepID=A0A7J6FZI8_CANSA|nr:hypothetical protein G4B88_004967 [Cannabis sativa]